ncbi:MAG: MBG domain-containing protein, partial [Actinomycetota bacterium]
MTTLPTCTTVYGTTTSVAATAANRRTSCAGAAADNYTFSYVTGLVTVGKKNVDVTADSYTLQYADAVPSVTATYSGFINSATASVIGGQTCTTTYSNLTSNVGSAQTTSCSGGTATDYSFTYYGGTVTVNQRAVVITASSPSVTYGDAVPTITPLVTLANGQTLSTPGVMTTQPTCVTTYTAERRVATLLADRTTSCSGAAAANYSFTYATGAVAIARKGVTVTASSPAVTYGDAVPTITPTYAGWITGEGPDQLTATPTCSTQYTTTTAVNASTALRQTSCSGAAADDYSFTYPTGAVTVSKKTVTVTARDYTVNYGDAKPTILADYVGFINGADATVISGQTCLTAYTATTVVAASAANRRTYCSGGTATNYAPAYVDGLVTVNQRPIVITASSHTLAYGAAVPTVTPSYTLVNSETSTALSTQPTCSTTYTVTTPVAAVLADRTTSCTGAVAANYSFSYTSGAVTVQQRSIVITASSPSVTYGDAVPTVTPSYTLVNSETSTALSTQPTCSTAYAPTSAFGTAPSTSCSGAVAANYSFTYTNGSVAIAKKGVMITASSITPNYGDAAPTVTASYDGFVNGQTQATAGVMTTLPTCTTTFSSSTTVAAGGTTSCSGAVAGNYSFSYTAGTATVQRRVVTITASSPTVTYGDAIPSIAVASTA